MSMKKIALFAGTTEGHRLCECFVQNKWQAEVFVATEYGREILPRHRICIFMPDGWTETDL